jgi:hypothetical protein
MAAEKTATIAETSVFPRSVCDFKGERCRFPIIVAVDAVRTVEMFSPDVKRDAERAFLWNTGDPGKHVLERFATGSHSW